MKRTRMRGRSLLPLLAVLVLAAPLAHAQPYPSKSIRLILGFSPGGPTDIVARIVTQKLTESMGIGAIVDTRPGADSIIGTGIASRAAPDGYTLVMISPSATIHHHKI